MFSNKIYKIDKNGKKRRVFLLRGLKINFHGKNAEIILYEPCVRFRNSTMHCGSDTKVIFQSSKTKLRQMDICAWSEGGSIEIGHNLLPNINCKILNYREPNLHIKIGDDCMMGLNVVIQSSDAHPIYSTETGKLVNRGADVEIGNHVWLTTDVKVMKGVKIADNCIIGSGSIVTKDCNMPNSIYAGIPTRLVKKNCNWDYEF